MIQVPLEAKVPVGQLVTQLPDKANCPFPQVRQCLESPAQEPQTDEHAIYKPICYFFLYASRLSQGWKINKNIRLQELSEAKVFGGHLATHFPSCVRKNSSKHCVHLTFFKVEPIEKP